jgi:hypothetical protein
LVAGAGFGELTLGSRASTTLCFFEVGELRLPATGLSSLLLEDPTVSEFWGTSKSSVTDTEAVNRSATDCSPDGSFVDVTLPTVNDSWAEFKGAWISSETDSGAELSCAGHSIGILISEGELLVPLVDKPDGY